LPPGDRPGRHLYATTVLNEGKQKSKGFFAGGSM
jgi:hypothetical protein